MKTFITMLFIIERTEIAHKGLTVLINRTCPFHQKQTKKFTLTMSAFQKLFLKMVKKRENVNF